MSFNLVGENDHDRLIKGTVSVRLLNSAGKEAARVVESVSIPPYGKQYIPTGIRLPEESGGYLVLAEYTPENSMIPPVLSRRYIKVGEKKRYAYFDYELKPLEY